MAKKKGRVPVHDYNNGNGYYRQTNTKRGWDTGDAPKVCTNCDFTPATQKSKIMMDIEVWKTIMALCKTVKLEWQALLKGTVDEHGVIHINGYYIPEQEVSAASVKNLAIIDDEFIALHQIVAGVHSHGEMGVFFSSTDVEHTNMSLIKHNIVVNNKFEYKAQSRVELPCGMVKFIDGELLTVGETPVTIVGAENIRQRTFGLATNTWNTHGNNGATAGTLEIKETGKKYDGVIDGLRWCPVCDRTPEEDNGIACTCWTKGLRRMLPDFTFEYYQLLNGRSYELIPPLEMKYSTKRDAFEDIPPDGRGDFYYD